MLAGMGGVSYHRLVAAVSEAGGFGCMGAAPMRREQMVQEIAEVRKLTAKPFGVDLLAALPDHLPAQVQDIIDGGARLFVAGLGVPRDVVELCHRNNVLVASMCGKVRHAIASVEAGCDIVIAQGTEAGGHTGSDRHAGPRAAGGRRRRRAGAGGGGRRHRRRARPGRGPRPRRRRHLGGHALHRHARGPHGAGVQGAARRAPRGRHHRHQGVHRQDLPGGARTATPRPSPMPAAPRSPSPCRS